MQTNNVYWQDKNNRAKKAEQWFEKMKNLPLGRSTIYDHFSYPPKPTERECNESVYVVDTDTVSALYDNKDAGKVCVLNFASYLNPGGMFLEGSKAQEECLCHESNLYNNLSSKNNVSSFYEYNSTHKGYGFYKDRAIYTEDVIFEKNNNQIKADVLTCAAPNLKAVAYVIINGYSPEFANDGMEGVKRRNHAILKGRMEFMRDIMLEKGVDTAILGAWGCGVFGQDPEEVAKLFKEVFAGSGINQVYAVPSGFHRENYDAFVNTFHDLIKDNLDIDDPEDIEL